MQVSIVPKEHVAFRSLDRERRQSGRQRLEQLLHLLPWLNFAQPVEPVINLDRLGLARKGRQDFV